MELSPSAAQVQDLVDANRILAHQGILDAFGHVSVRHDRQADRFLLARNIAPAQARAEDIMTFDLNGEPVQPDGKRVYLERFIHSAIYQARPEVVAIVHSPSAAVLPFSVSGKATLRPICHMSGFLARGAPMFEIRESAGSATDLLIRDGRLGAALASSLGQAHMVLMRGHGSTVVGPSLKLAVYRAIYAEVNARTQVQAMQLGDPTYLTPEEAETAMESVESQVDRPWNLWKQACVPTDHAPLPVS